MPSGLAYPGGIRSGGPKPGKKSAKETASKINKQNKTKKKNDRGEGEGGGRRRGGEGPDSLHCRGPSPTLCWLGGRTASPGVSVVFCR